MSQFSRPDFLLERPLEISVVGRLDRLCPFDLEELVLATWALWKTAPDPNLQPDFDLLEQETYRRCSVSYS